MKYRTIDAYLKAQNALEELAKLHGVEDDTWVRQSIQYMLESSGITNSQMEYVESLVNAIVNATEKKYNHA